MLSKNQIRKKYSNLRKNKYFEISDKYYKPIIKLINNFSKKKKIKISFYYPSNYEVNTLVFFKMINKKKRFIPLLPQITSKNGMKFYQWNYLETLKVNKYGMLEPTNLKKPLIPNILLIPLLAFDTNKNRLGYGKGFYDKFLNKYLKKNKDILTIGIAFSFQKYNKLPTSKYDVKLDYILTEDGLK